MITPLFVLYIQYNIHYSSTIEVNDMRRERASSTIISKMLFTFDNKVQLCLAIGFFSFVGQRLCGDVLHKSQQRTRGCDLRSCLWQDQIRWLLSKSGNHVVIRFGNLAPFRLENCFRPKIGPEIGPGPLRATIHLVPAGSMERL